ncbi:hypothetical protein [Halovulum sp. GXIMD14793]
MRKIGVVAMLAALGTTSATAGDWTGFYSGVSLGYGQSEVATDEADGFT